MSSLLPQNNHCPYLLLAPMEGVGDQCFRRAIASIGGFDEAVTEFISVPAQAHVQSLAKVYQADELSPLPLAAQIMGADPHLMAAMAVELEKRGAPRIDINCGCPSNTVTGRGAGSSLLKTPSFLYELAKTVVAAVSIPVTLKMRSGYEDLSLFEDNLLAAEESGVSFITLHPRTKVEGYTPPARWDLIAQAKKLLTIPVVGNGDICSVEDAIRIIRQTSCDALMIGRGALINPLLFHQIRAHFTGIPFSPATDCITTYLETFVSSFPAALTQKGRIGKIKQLFSFLFRANPFLLAHRPSMLTHQETSPLTLMKTFVPILEKGFFS